MKSRLDYLNLEVISKDDMVFEDRHGNWHIYLVYQTIWNENRIYESKNDAIEAL